MEEQQVSLDRLIEYVLSLVEEENVSDDESVDMDQDDLKTLNPLDTHNLNNFSNNLKEFVGPYSDEYFRYGITSHNSNKNISLFFSILHCLNDRFINLDDDEKMVYIKELNSKMCTDISKIYTKNSYKVYGWTKKLLREYLKTYSYEKIVLLFASDYFNINIFIFNHDEDKLYAVYPEEGFNKYKPLIVLSYYQNVYEPIVSNDRSYFSYHDDIIKMIIDNNYDKIIAMSFHKKRGGKEFNIVDENLDQYIEEDEILEVKEEVEVEDNNFFDDNLSEITDDEDLIITEVENISETKGIFCKKVDNNDFKVNIKMKLDSIQEVAEKFNISIVKGKTKTGKDKMKTKAQLCEEINSVIS